MNVRCPVELTQKLAPHMAENGRVVMVSSGLAMTIPEESGYHKLKEAKTLEDLYAIKFLPEDNVQSIFAPAYSVSKVNRQASWLYDLRSTLLVDAEHGNEDLVKI